MNHRNDRGLTPVPQNVVIVSIFPANVLDIMFSEEVLKSPYLIPKGKRIAKKSLYTFSRKGYAIVDS